MRFTFSLSGENVWWDGLSQTKSFHPWKEQVVTLGVSFEILACSPVISCGSDKHVDRETNTTRLTAILNDAALRLLFREYLRETVCEENLAFYLDVVEFDKNFKSIDSKKPDAVRETLAAAYGMPTLTLHNGYLFDYLLLN